MVARLILVQQIAVRVRSSQPSCKVRPNCREIVGCKMFLNRWAEQCRPFNRTILELIVPDFGEMAEFFRFAGLAKIRICWAVRRPF